MVPKAVQDAGYTAVGLGVLALQHVQIQRRSIARQASAVLGPVGRVLDAGRARLCQAFRPNGG
jgi:hypothetical protein